MKYKKQCLSLVLVLVCFQAFAIEEKVLKSTDKFPKALYVRNYSKVSKLKKLSQIQWYVNKEKWTDCVKASEAVLGNQSLGVWVPYQHLDCLQKAYSFRSPWKVSRFIESFNKLAGQLDQVLNSPYPGHREKVLQVFLDLANLSLEKSRNQFDRLIENNHNLVDYMDESQRAEYYRIMGEIGWLRQKNEIAKTNFLRSYFFRQNSNVLSRIKQLKAEESLHLDKYSRDFSESDEENKLWGKFANAVKKGQTYRVAEYGSDFLNQFPGSKRVEEVRDDVNTFYKRLLYRRKPKYEAVKRDFERQLMEAPPQHILFWATEAYERGYQSSSYKLADKAADKWEDTAYAADALLIAGRSAYYLNKRSEARSHFNTLIEKFSGHPASDEAQYLLGLLYYRDKEYKKVINLYDSFLMSSGSDKWELQVRYWLWRSLRKIESSRASDIAETIFRIFPLTYYGLIVRMEEKKGLQNLIGKGDDRGQAEYWWTAHTKKRWNRIKKLIELGWLDQAETEIDFLPDPKTAGGFLVRAQLWQSGGRPNRAIEDFAAAVDLEPKYINRTVLDETFPKKYESFVKAAQKEFSISKNLIWSIMRQESAFRETAVSPSNAYGLMQMLGSTAKETARWLRVKNFKVSDDVFDPKTNIRFGTHFISRMVGKYKGVIPLAVASYNVGPGNLDRWLRHRSDLKDWDKIGQSLDDDIWMDELPWAETSFYVKAVMRNFLLYKIIHDKDDKLSSPPWAEVLR